MKYIVDRFEGNYAILELFNTTNFVNVLKSKLPSNVRVGDIVEFNNGIYTILENATVQRKESIKARFERLRKNK